MAVNVGNLEATLGMDTKGFKDGVKEAEKGTKGLGDSLTGLGTMATAAAAVAVAALVAIGVSAVSAATDFQKSMTEVFTLLPDASEDMYAELNSQSKDFAVKFGVNLKEVSAALYNTVSAGVAAEDAISFMEVAQKAASGGVTDLSTAVDGITSVINAYGTDVISATEASDLMFTAVKLGKTTFGELSASLFQVIPTASSLGVEFGDVTAALAAMTAQGTPTNVASTQLKQALLELSDESKETGKTFKETAGVGFKEFIAQGHNVQDALKLMEGAAKKNGVEVNQLFGSVQAGGAVLALTGKGSETFANDLEAMGDAAGATDVAFNKMEQTFAKQIDKIKARIEVLLVSLGEYLLPIIDSVITPLMAAFDEVMNWWKGSGEGIFDKIGVAFQFLKETIQPFIDLYMDFWRNQATKMTDFWEEDGEMVMQALSNLFEAFKWVVDGLATLWTWLWPYMEGIYGPAIDILLDIVGIFAALFAGDWETLGEKLIDLSLDLMDLMYGVFELGFDAVLGLFVAIGNGINAVLTGAWNMVLGGLEAMINKAIDMLNRMIAAMNKIPGVNIPLIGKVSFERAEAKTIKAPKLSDFTGGEKPTDKIRAQIEADRPAKEKETKEVAKQTATEIAKEMAKTKPVVPKPSEMPPNKPVEIVTDKPIRVEGITENAIKDLTAELKMFSFESIVDAINNARDMLIAAITPKEETEVSEEEEITPATLGEKISQALSETFTNMSANGADFDVDTMSNMPLILNQDIHITTEIDGYEIGKAVYSTWNKRTGGGLNI